MSDAAGRAPHAWQQPRWRTSPSMQHQSSTCSRSTVCRQGPGSCMRLKGAPSSRGMAAFARRAAAALEFHTACTFATWSGFALHCNAFACMTVACTLQHHVHVHVHAGDRGAAVAAAAASRAAQPPLRLAQPWAAARPRQRALRLAAGYEQRPLSQEERGRRSGCTRNSA